MTKEKGNDPKLIWALASDSVEKEIHCASISKWNPSFFN